MIKMNGPREKYLFVELHWKGGTLRIGSCFAWAVACVALGYQGNAAASSVLPLLVRWFAR